MEATPTLFETKEGAELVYADVDELHPHPHNPRIEYDNEVVVSIASRLEAEGRFAEEHALLTRPHPDGTGYQIVSGHHRWQAAMSAGLESVPIWVRGMDDQEAYMLLVTENDQSELSRLEIGLHALKTTKRYGEESISDYAKRIDRDQSEISKWRGGARVADSMQRRIHPDTNIHALYEVSKAPEEMWEPLVRGLTEKDWSVRDTRKKRKDVEAFDIPARWENVFLDPREVVEEYLRSDEGFSPQTVSRLAEQADKTISLIEAHDVDRENWTDVYEEWLEDNAGPNGRSERPYRQDAWRLRGLKNQRKKLKAELESAEQHRRWTWNHGDWRDCIGSLEDESVNLLLTDPPYGLHYDNNRGYRNHDQLQGDGADAAKELAEMLEAIRPKLAEDAHVLVFAHWSTEPDMRAAVAERYELRGSLVWDKDEHGTGDLDGAFAPSHERILHAVKGNPSMAHRERDVIQAAKVKSDLHPTVKPQPLLKTLIKATTVEGELVADPFGGVASTPRAALSLDRRGWGAEINEDYFAAGQQLLQDELS